MREHAPAVRSFLAFLGCPTNQLDDLLQEVFVSVLASPFEDRGAASTRSYLRTVAKHLFLKSVRRERRNVPLEDTSAAESLWIEEFERDDDGAGYLQALRDCLSRLTGRARQALQLRYEKGLGQRAIGAELALSESGVKSILVRTRSRLRECVQERLQA